jgi:hypothetical protein
MICPEKQDKAVKRVELPDWRSLPERIFQRMRGKQTLGLWP